MNNQEIRVIGRNRLVNELLEAGLKVSKPDREGDLLAHLNSDDVTKRSVGIPIQMMVASDQAFSVSQKHEKIDNLILAYVWGVNSTTIKPITYALTYAEAFRVAEEMSWTKTPSWIDGKYYTMTHPSKYLLKLLETYRMSPERWRQKLIGLTQGR